MQPVQHEITHYFQPTNHSCCQTAHATLLSHYGKSLSPEAIVADSPVTVDENGNDFGTMVQQLATWTLAQGFDVTMYAYDFQILDLNWSGLSSEQLIERLEAVRPKRDIASLGAHFSKMYVDGYIDFLRAGGTLHIKPWLSAEFLYERLAEGPVHFSLAASPFFGKGRSRNEGLRVSVDDDIDGNIFTHSIVVYGFNEDGDFLVSDPWKVHEHPVQRDRLLAAFASAAYLCDNLFFQVTPK